MRLVVGTCLWFFAGVVGVCAGWFPFVGQPAAPPAFYASPSGSGTDCSLASPCNLATALAGNSGGITAGSTVYLRGGTYASLTGFSETVSGANNSKITFDAYPAESPVLDGAYPEFETGSSGTPNTAWALCSTALCGAQTATHNIYRSVNAFTTVGEEGGFIVMDDASLVTLATIPWGTGWISSDEQNWVYTVSGRSDRPSPFYPGYGIAWNPVRTGTVTFTNASPTVITWSGGGVGTTTGVHPGDIVTFTNSGGALPTGISAGVDYYVLNNSTFHTSGDVPIAGTFNISLSAGGAAVNTTSAGTGTQTIHTGDGHIFIRLDTPTAQSQLESPATEARTVPTIADVDPRNHPIYLWNGEGVGIDVTGSHVVLGSGIRISNYHTGINLHGSGLSDTYLHSTVDVGYTCVSTANVQVTAGGPVVIDGMTCDGHMLPTHYWVAWGDIKDGCCSGNGPMQRGRKLMFDLQDISGLRITNSTVSGAFDGIITDTQSTNIQADHSTWNGMWDDMWQMGGTITQVEVNNNFIYGAGPSHDSTGAVQGMTGVVYVHHNVIDTTLYPVFAGRFGSDRKGVYQSNVFSTHGSFATSLNVSGAVSDGGLCKLTVTSSNTGLIGDVRVVVANIVGATACNGTWTAHRIDATHIDLLASTFGSAYTSGGSVSVPGASEPWKIYYNTIVQDTSYRSGTALLNTLLDYELFGGPYTQVGAVTNVTQAGVHEVYNNIIVQGKQLGTVFATASGYEKFDGNDYYPTGVTYMWRHMILNTGSPIVETQNQVDSVAHMKASAAFTNSKGTYTPGWENSGCDCNPQLNGSYQPQNAAVQTGAVNITARGFPGASSYEAWRGAVQP